jgi:hypothetical protein
LGPTKKQRIKLKLEYMLSGEETQAGRTGEILSQTKQYEQIESLVGFPYQSPSLEPLPH